nr:DNA-directed DNA polymerase [Tanacetum cinerariifolium]
MLPVTQIDTFYNDLTLRHRDTINAAAEGTFMKRHPEECYDLIENMTAYHNDSDTLAQRSKSSNFITSSSDTEIAALKAKMAEINKNLMRVLQVNQQVKTVALSYETCGGPHSFSDCPATIGNIQNVYAARAYQEELVPSFLVPLRMMVSLIPVLVLKVMVLIVLVLILVETWCVLNNCLNDSGADYGCLEVGKNYLDMLLQHIRFEYCQRWLDNRRRNEDHHKFHISEQLFSLVG